MAIQNIQQSTFDPQSQSDDVVTVRRSRLMAVARKLKRKYQVDTLAEGQLIAATPNQITTRRHGGPHSQAVQVISQQASGQLAYLMSIDATLKEIKSYLQFQFASSQRGDSMAAARRATSVIKTIPAPKRRLIEKKEKTIGKEGESDNSGLFNAANFLRYGAALASAGYDTYQGYQNSDQWGVSGPMGAMSAFLGGTKSGAMNAVKKSIDLGTIGGMLKGPTGAIIGIITGAISGWFGGEKIAKFMNSLVNGLGSTIIEKIQTDLSMGIESFLSKKVDNFVDSIYDVRDTMGDVITMLTHAFNQLKVSMVRKMGDSLNSMSNIPGLGFMKESGDLLLKKADDMEQGYQADENSEAQATNKERTERKANLKKGRETRNKDLADRKDQNSFANVIGAKIDKAADATSDKPIKEVATEKKPTEQTAAPQRKVREQDIIKSDLSVGQVPGSDIKAAADAASKNMGINGNLDDKVDALTLAQIVAQESSGQIKVKNGDGGRSAGVTQMGEDALKDVNAAFGTNFDQNTIKSDYRAGLLAAALFLKLKLHAKQGNTFQAIAAFNGSGELAGDYAAEATSRTPALVADATPPSFVPPAPKASGAQMIAQSKENEDAKDNRARAMPVSAPVVAAPSVNINQSKTINNIPQPRTRNDDATMIEAIYWIR